MPLSPAPLPPGWSPLPPLGQAPPTRRALLIGALIALPTLIVSLLIGQLTLTPILFLAPGLQSEAHGGVGGDGNGSGGSATFQGFVYPWTHRDSGGGYTTPASLKNMRSEAQTYHMNAVIIPIVADMPSRSESRIDWKPGNKDTLPDSDYIAAIQDAKKAGLTPVLELRVLQQDRLSREGTSNAIDETSQSVGAAWSNRKASSTFQTEDGRSVQVGDEEKQWFDAYTEFAVYFAQLSQKYSLSYFVIGDELTSVAYDTDRTKDADHDVPGDNCPKDAGRRDCGWRHVAHAVRSATYATFQDHNAQKQGGGYTGKLIYAASWGGAQHTSASDPEFENITWWNAIDYIGIDAQFPLTQGNGDVPASQLADAWHGKGDGLCGQGDIYGRIAKVANAAGRPVVFTSAGYASVPGANAQNCAGFTLGANYDGTEQLNDMQALLQTFSAGGWWQGVFWTGDRPVDSREKDSGWLTSTAWAGDSPKTSKPAGQWLATYYQNAPLK